MTTPTRHSRAVAWRSAEAVLLGHPHLPHRQMLARLLLDSRQRAQRKGAVLLSMVGPHTHAVAPDCMAARALAAAVLCEQIAQVPPLAESPAVDLAQQLRLAWSGAPGEAVTALDRALQGWSDCSRAAE